MDPKIVNIQKIGNFLVDVFHYFALFVIGATVVWSAIYEYLHMMEKGYAALKDILLLFIYLELGAMIGIYFKTHRLPVQFLIFIAITALSRHLVIGCPAGIRQLSPVSATQYLGRDRAAQRSAFRAQFHRQALWTPGRRCEQGTVKRLRPSEKPATVLQFRT